MAEQQLNDARAKLLRLGCQVAAATLEATQAAHDKMVAERAKCEREEELASYKAEQTYLIQKAETEALARRECARERDAANKMRKAVADTSQRRLLAKKELSERLSCLQYEYDEVHFEVRAEQVKKRAR